MFLCVLVVFGCFFHSHEVSGFEQLPSMDAQPAVLRFYEQRYALSLSKGNASSLLDAVMLRIYKILTLINLLPKSYANLQIPNMYTLGLNNKAKPTMQDRKLPWHGGSTCTSCKK